MIIKSREKENKKFFDEFYYIALNCGSFRKHPNKKARSATKYLVFLAILFFVSSIALMFVPELELISFMLFIIFFYLVIILIIIKRHTKKMGNENSLIKIDEDGIEDIYENKISTKLYWDYIDHIIINKYSICVIPKSNYSILIGIEISSKDEVIECLKKYKKIDLLIDNTEIY